jgi:hypothetical protein
MPDHLPNRQTAHENAAYLMGRDAALARASWVVDGNTDAAAIAGVVRMLDNGEDVSDYLPARPDLSGEWADEMNPARLFEEVSGWDAHAEASFSVDAFGDYVDALCEAWEAGVSDTFEAECERILRAALPTSADITAPRFADGNLLGRYPVTLVRLLPTGDSNPGFLVRFEDGHEAGAFRRELRATARGWEAIDALQRASRGWEVNEHRSTNR